MEGLGNRQRAPKDVLAVEELLVVQERLKLKLLACAVVYAQLTRGYPYGLSIETFVHLLQICDVVVLRR